VASCSLVEEVEMAPWWIRSSERVVR
jgi:hypothetical protein